MVFYLFINDSKRYVKTKKILFELIHYNNLLQTQHRPFLTRLVNLNFLDQVTTFGIFIFVLNSCFRLIVNFSIL